MRRRLPDMLAFLILAACAALCVRQAMSTPPPTPDFGFTRAPAADDFDYDCEDPE